MFKILGHLQKLADEIAILAKRLAMNTIPQTYISLLLACRLVPLKKDNGIRSVGVGECLWWIIAKTITRLLKEDIIHEAGTLQTCASLESGIEAAIHSVRSFQDEESDCLLLVDAENAFNNKQKREPRKP